MTLRPLPSCCLLSSTTNDNRSWRRVKHLFAASLLNKVAILSTGGCSIEQACAVVAVRAQLLVVLSLTVSVRMVPRPREEEEVLVSLLQLRLLLQANRKFRARVEAVSRRLTPFTGNYPLRSMVAAIMPPTISKFKMILSKLSSLK